MRICFLLGQQVNDTQPSVQEQIGVLHTVHWSVAMFSARIHHFIYRTYSDMATLDHFKVNINWHIFAETASRIVG